MWKNLFFCNLKSHNRHSFIIIWVHAQHSRIPNLCMIMTNNAVHHQKRVTTCRSCVCIDCIACTFTSFKQGTISCNIVLVLILDVYKYHFTRCELHDNIRVTHISISLGHNTSYVITIIFAYSLLYSNSHALCAV